VSLSCELNELTTIDVSKNTALTGLYSSFNKLTKIDVSGNKALIRLTCNRNQLTSLDLRNNTSLSVLHCFENYFPNKSAILGLNESNLSVFEFDPQWTSNSADNSNSSGNPYNFDDTNSTNNQNNSDVTGNSEAPNTIDSAAEWARAEIVSAIVKGFVPLDLQDNYTDTITMQEFCRTAINFIEYALRKDIDSILAERNLKRNPKAFTDTTDPYILAAFALGLTNGISAPAETVSGKFLPERTFTRQDAATMLMQVCRVIGMNISNPPASDFTDLSDASVWALTGINFVRANGIMQGTDPTTPTFSPKETFTRQESLVTFDRIQIIAG
jgi:hypothetical protein